jgi:hypothetical protein
MSQAGRKRMAAATVDDGLGNGFFWSRYEAASNETISGRPPVHCRVAEERFGRHRSGPGRNAKEGSSHRRRIKIKIIP